MRHTVLVGVDTEREWAEPKDDGHARRLGDRDGGVRIMTTAASRPLTCGDKGEQSDAA
jgi:hypothetical protein